MSTSQHAQLRAGYPPARISMTPLLELTDLFGRSAAGSVFMADDRAITASGRTAIAHALRLSGVKGGDEVLVPAYHCPAMIEPVIWAGATPIYYPLDAGLNLDLTQIESLRTDKTKAVLAAHFLAQARDFSSLRSWCDEEGVSFIEDCAHALYSHIGDEPVGTLGDYAVASLWKFLPTGDGGVIHSSRHPVADLQLEAGESDLKTLFRLVENAASLGRWPLLKPSFALLNRLRGGAQSPSAQETESESTTLPDYSLTDTEVAQGAPELVDHLRATAFDESKAQLRRNRFAEIREGVQGTAGAEDFPLELNDDDVPYVVPVLLKDPDRQFPALKQRGFPVWRWEDLMTDICTVSQDYRWRLIQLPCHQNLSDPDVDWIIETFRKTLVGPDS